MRLADELKPFLADLDGADLPDGPNGARPAATTAAS